MSHASRGAKSFRPSCREMADDLREVEDVMAGKYNTRHNRSMSKYPERLRARGMNNVSVRMEDVEVLRRCQPRETRKDINPYDSLGIINTGGWRN